MERQRLPEPYYGWLAVFKSMVESGVLKTNTFNENARVYFAVASLANPKTLKTLDYNASNDAIHKLTDINVKNVSRAIKKLVEIGMLKETYHQNGVKSYEITVAGNPEYTSIKLDTPVSNSIPPYQTRYPRIKRDNTPVSNVIQGGIKRDTQGETPVPTPETNGVVVSGSLRFGGVGSDNSALYKRLTTLEADETDIMRLRLLESQLDFIDALESKIVWLEDCSKNGLNGKTVRSIRKLTATTIKNLIEKYDS